MSPIEVVSARYDERIPPAAWDAAVAAMASYKPAPAEAGGTPLPPLAESKRRAVTARDIAAVLIARAGADGACTEADLDAAGFTRAELARHLGAARAIARRARLEG